MTVVEMHIELDQKLQELFSFKNARILPEAKDLALRQAEEQIIKQNIDVRFEDRETKLKNISALIEKNRAIPTVIPSVNDSHYEPNAVCTSLPADFLYGVNYRGEVISSKIDCEEAPELGTTTRSLYTTIVGFPTSNLVTGPFYTGFVIRKNGPSTLYSLPSAYTGRFYSKDQKYEIIQHVLETFNVPGSTRVVYWERYKDTFAANSFIFISTVADTSITITIYNSNGITVDNTITGTTVISSETVYNRNLIPELDTDETNISYPSLKVMEGDLIYKARLNSFTKTKEREPHAALTTFNLYVYELESFIVTRVSLDYIRKPKQISLVLNQSSELDGSIHREIVDRAVELLKKNIQDPTLQTEVQYNDLKTRN